jgi:hypothetical protein
MGLFYMAGEQGFEPWLAESESAVLPLDDSPKNQRRIIQHLIQIVCINTVKTNGCLNHQHSLTTFFLSDCSFSLRFFLE